MHKEYKNARLIKNNIDTAPFIEELNSYLKSHSWMTNRSEKTYEQQHTLNINLRVQVMNDMYPQVSETPLHQLVSNVYPFFKKTYNFIENFGHEQKSELCRAMIVLLKPHSQVYRHYDKGSYYATRNRYHIVIQSSGSKMTCGEEIYTWKEGELWWFNNKLPHEAFNDSDKDRIHIIFDLLPIKPSPIIRIQNYLIKQYSLLKYSGQE